MDYIETLLFNNLFMRMQEHVKEPEDITLVSTQELGARGAEAHATLEKMKVELRDRALPVMASALGISADELGRHLDSPILKSLPAIIFGMVGLPVQGGPDASAEASEGGSETWRLITPKDQALLQASPHVKSTEFRNTILLVELDPASLMAIPNPGVEPLADKTHGAVTRVIGASAAVDRDSY